MSRELVEAPRTTPCRKCFAKVPVAAKYCPECGASKKFDTVPAIFIVLLLASSLLLMSSTFVTTKQVLAVNSGSTPLPSQTVTELPAPKDLSQSAYQAAKRLVQERLPGALRISEPNESPVSKNGDIFQVTLFVDLVENGAPSRNVYQVKLIQDRGNWQLREISK